MSQKLITNRLDNRGGKRENAGRPPTDNKTFQIRCKPQNIQTIRNFIKLNNL